MNKPILYHITILFMVTSFALRGQSIKPITLDTLGNKVITDFIIEGNKLTKPRIILRELTLKVGDSLQWVNINAAMRQSENNLMNLGLFNFVNLQAIQSSEDHVIILISVQERWYIYPVPILEIAQTNFNTWWKTRELRWLNYGLYVSHNNFRGRNEDISLTLRFGYTKKFSASYSIPNLNKRQTLGLYLGAGFYENEQIVLTTKDNERVFYENREDKARQYYQYKAGLSYREDIFLKHYFEVSYFRAQVRDSVPLLQPDYFTGNGSTSEFLRATYVVNYDTRDYRKYPLKGVLLSAALQQDGWGLVNDKGLSLFTTQASYRHHYKLSKKFYLAYNFSAKVNWDKPPYYLLRGLGYGELVRGYEYYIIDGTRWGLFQSNFKYELLKPREVNLPFIPSKKFSKTFVALYSNLFFDSGYVYGEDFARNNSLVNQYLYSIGLGLDLVTYYDKVVRFEGSYNGLGQAGFRVEFKQSF